MKIDDVSGVPLDDLVSLRGRRSVITGGARGIGYAIARRLAEAGSSVVIGDISEQQGVDAASKLSAISSSPVLFRRVDVNDSGQVSRFVNQCGDDLGGIDILVNNAGIYPSKSFVDLEDADWDRVVGTNLRGSFLCAREVARRMMQQEPARGTCIIFVVSVSGFRGRSGLSHYVASKHGLVGLIKSMALELAPRGIRVLGVAPTLVETPGIHSVGQLNSKDDEEKYRQFLVHTESQIPLGRVGVADDVARAVFFCASDLAMFMTGSVLMVDGGYTV